MKNFVECVKCGRLRYEDRMESRLTWGGKREYRCLARSSCKAARQKAREVSVKLTLDDFREGMKVTYQSYPGAPVEHGVVTGVGVTYVYVRYGEERTPKATAPGNLKIVEA